MRLHPGGLFFLLIFLPSFLRVTLNVKYVTPIALPEMKTKKQNTRIMTATLSHNAPPISTQIYR